MHASLYEFFVSRVLFSCLKLNFFFFHFLHLTSVSNKHMQGLLYSEQNGCRAVM